MQNKSDRGTVVGILFVYACTIVSLLNLHPSNPLIAGVKYGLMWFFLTVCAYALVLWKKDGLTGLVVCSPAESFSPLTIKIIHAVVSVVCGFIIAYPLHTALPLITDHHSLKGWRNAVQLQTKIIEKVEGRQAAQKYWNQCLSHIISSARFYEHKGNLAKALDYYSECKQLEDETSFSCLDLSNVLGLICDRLNEFEVADVHYLNSGDVVDEYSTGLHALSHARLLRIFRFVPEEIVISDFPWGRDLASMKDADAIKLAQYHIIIDFSKLDDYQKQLLRPAFHREMLTGKSKLSARQLVSLGENWKQPYSRVMAKPVVGLMLSDRPIVFDYKAHHQCEIIEFPVETRVSK